MPSKQEKLSLVKQLIILAKADKDYRAEEHFFLSKMAGMLGIDMNEFESLFEQNIRLSPPPFEPDRILQFHRLVLLMNVDHERSKEEQDFIREAGLWLGLNPLAVNEVLRLMPNYANGMIPADTLVKVFRVHHN